jgi:hypothetical protein
MRATLGKYSPDIDDVKAVALPILRHRVFQKLQGRSRRLEH